MNNIRKLDPYYFTKGHLKKKDIPPPWDDPLM